MGKFSFNVLLVAIFAFLGFSTAVQAQEESPSPVSLYNDGLAKLKEKAYSEALPLFEQAIEAADPEEESEAKVIQLSKRNGSIAAYKVGNSMRKEEKYDEALKAFTTGIEFNPGFYANYIGKAQTLEGQGEDLQAVTAYVEAAEASQKAGKADKHEQLLSKASNFAAKAYADKKWDETIELAEAFLETQESADTHYYLAVALKEKGQGDKAIAHAEKGMELETGSDKGRYLYTKAEVLESMGKTDEAAATYSQITSGKYAERAKYKADQLNGGK